MRLFGSGGCCRLLFPGEKGENSLSSVSFGLGGEEGRVCTNEFSEGRGMFCGQRIVALEDNVLGADVKGGQ